MNTKLIITILCMSWWLTSFGQGPTCTLSQTNIPCNGQCTAATSASCTGGTSPYTYNWSTGQTGASVSGLCAGSYTLIVTDANSMSCTQIITITEPSAISAALSSTQTSCGNSDGTATVTPSGGTGSYTYSWSTTPIQTTQTATGLSAGNYSVTVQDANGCSLTATVTLTMPDQPAPFVPDVAICLGDSTTLTAYISGGTAPYTYLWSTGHTASSIIVNPPASSTYTIMASDANGCTGASLVNVFVDSVSTSLTLVQDTANTLTWYGYVTITGTSPFTYYWDFGDGNNSTQPAPQHTYSVAGNYIICVTVTDMNACTGSSCDTTYRLSFPEMIQTLIVVNPLVTGIIHENVSEKVSIYPNPFDSYATLELHSPADHAEINIYNCFGQLVKQLQNISGQTVTLTRDNLPGGLYFLRLTEDNKTVTTNKLMITGNL